MLHVAKILVFVKEMENNSQHIRNQALFLEAELQFHLIQWKQRSSELAKFIEQMVNFKATNQAQLNCLLALKKELNKEIADLKVEIKEKMKTCEEKYGIKADRAWQVLNNERSGR
jgi:hypothetical protein